MKVLVVAPNWIGDAVMSLSLIQAMYLDPSLRGHSDALPEIHVLAPPVTAPVYRFCPAIASVQVEPFTHGKLQWGLRRRVGRALQSQGYELAVVLPNSLKSALVPWFARIPRRVGYSGELRSAILTRALPKPSKTNKPPMIEWYGRLGGFAGESLAYPAMRVEPAMSREACLHFGLSAGFLALAPGAEFGPAKRWPAEHFAEVATRFLMAFPDNKVVLLGGPKDVAFCEEITACIPEAQRTGIVDLAGKTNLPQAVALLAVASQLLTNDSGLMHVAAALNVRVHAVYGSSSPHHTPPLNPSARVYYLNLSCSPCYQRVCPLGHLDCLKKLDPKMVLEQVVPASQGV